MGYIQLINTLIKLMGLNCNSNEIIVFGTHLAFPLGFLGTMQTDKSFLKIRLKLELLEPKESELKIH